jgi:hypothetical protein
MANVHSRYNLGGLQFFEGANTVLDIAQQANGGVKPRITTALVDGAIGIFSQSVYITKATAAALTIAAPTAGTHDGVTIDIISTTAQAHTVTATTIGFNAGGAASDVGTFATAIGNGLRIQAYQGEWYVLNNIGVTLA